MKIQHLATALAGAVLLATACTSDLSELAGPEVADDELTQPRFKATTLTEQTRVEFVSSPQWNPCAGEYVVFHIRLHIVDHETEDEAGGLHINGSGNFQGSYGVGQTSGLTYRLVGRSGFGFGGPLNMTNGAEVDHFVLKQRWVAVGSADDYSLSVLFTVIVNANGDVTVDILKIEEECGNLEI